jgi:TonB family protein
VAASGAPSPAPAPPLYDAASKDVTAPVPQRTEVRVPDSLRWSLPTGDVVVELIVSTAGTVESVTVRQSPDAVFGALVARAVMDWRYRPASRAGKPVRYRMMTKVVVSK